MPRGKRTPIEYKTQFGDGIFRTREIVDAERAEVEETETADLVPPISESTSTVPLSVRSTERPNDRIRVRQQVRHSFDIWHDQLQELAQIQVQMFGQTGRKPKVGELVREALDAYIGARKRTVERTNGRARDPERAPTE